MKHIYNLEHPRIKPARVVDSIKHDIKKYLKKERRNELPIDASRWGFDCKVGQSAESAIEVPLTSLSQTIDTLVADGIMNIYVEIAPVAIEREMAAKSLDEDSEIDEAEKTAESYEEDEVAMDDDSDGASDNYYSRGPSH